MPALGATLSCHSLSHPLQLPANPFLPLCSVLPPALCQYCCARPLHLHLILPPANRRHVPPSKENLKTCPHLTSQDPQHPDPYNHLFCSLPCNRCVVSAHTEPSWFMNRAIGERLQMYVPCRVCGKLGDRACLFKRNPLGSCCVYSVPDILSCR